MKLRTVLPMLAVATFALTACASKVNYEEFHKKAVEAVEKAKDVSYSKVVVGGYTKDEDGKKEEFDNVEIRFEKGAYATKSALLSDPVAYASEGILVGMLTALRADMIGEEENTTYYAGSTFKVVSEKDGDKYTAEWNEFGLLTSMDGDGTKYTVKYTK